jgi:hypothetical protein
MSQSGTDVSTERERLIFGAGFVFGVMFTMLILAVVLAAIVPGPVTVDSLLRSTVLLPIVSAILLGGVVGCGLYYLALPESGFGLRERPVFPQGEEHDVETE